MLDSDTLLTSWVFYLLSCFSYLRFFLFYGSVQNTSVSPDGKLLAVLGDSVECLLADAQSGKVRNCHGSPTKLFPHVLHSLIIFI